MSMPMERDNSSSLRIAVAGGIILFLFGVCLVVSGVFSLDSDIEADQRVHRSESEGIQPVKTTRRPIIPRNQAGDAPATALLQLSPDQQSAQLEAVRRLAALGTPDAVNELASFIAELPPGDFREQVVHLASAISNTAAVPTALQLLQSSLDAGVIRMCQEIFSRLANAETMQSMLDMYDNSADPALRDRLERTVACVSNEEAVPALKFVVMDTAMPTTDGMIRASAQALRQMGTPPAADALIERLNSEQSDAAGGIIAEQIAGIRNPIAEPSLHTAARGNSKFATNVRTRVAAIGALLNHPSAETQELLGALINDPQQEVASSAKEILSEIQRRLNK
jgi:HEAT repeat protein